MYSSLALVLAAVFMTSQWSPVMSHGRLWTPPGRASMWRKGFRTPANYNDNQMFCGGLHHQISLGYKCGLCGDPYDGARLHEAGGKYATGTIAATYKQGQEVVLEVDLTANHKGWFEFKVCATNDPKKKATQECLDLNPLQLSDGSGTKLYVSDLGSNMISIPVKLPKDLTCDFCMLQWRYHCGNNWGGFNAQEEFYGCADIKIEPSSNAGRPKSPVQMTSGDIFKLSSRMPTTSQPKAEKRTTKRTVPFIPPHPDKPQVYDKVKPRLVTKCKATMSVPGLDAWCDTNCASGKCPASHCKCKKVLALPTDV